jgi:uncharacterized membrane protein YeiH
MDFHHWLYLLDLAGTFIFAVSGVLCGIKKEMDIFGMLVLGVATASGGGCCDQYSSVIHPYHF